MRQIDCIVFDFGNVLVRWHPRNLYSRMGYTDTEMTSILVETKLTPAGCVRCSCGLASAFVMIAIAGLLAFIAWWLRTWRNERLRPALIFLTEHVPCLAIMAAGMGLSIYLEDHFKWPGLLAFATTLAVVFAICIPWWRWAYPAIERALVRASHRALRAGVVLAIAVTLLAVGGAWAYVYVR